jgi:UDP-N-acetylglucosamine 4,6-dehydratase
MFNGKSLLVTGGTGSFGQSFVNYIIRKYPRINRLVIFSRDELKQYEMAEQFKDKKYNFIRFFLGDVRDKERLKKAFEKIDYIIHAAALKQVPTAEYNPSEFVKTNIIGAQNIIDAAIDTRVKKVIALSTDKAAAPINLYGATKLCSDKIFTSANNMTGSKKIIFSVVRYGNVMGSRGSVIPYFKKFENLGYLPITDIRMTRFNITMNQSIDLVLSAFKSSKGGEIFVPKIPSYRITDLAKAINPKCKIKIIGIRPGEKLHEEMITSSDSYSTFDRGKYYVIINPSNENIFKYYKKNFRRVSEGFSYNSEQNQDFLTVKKLIFFIKKI